MNASDHVPALYARFGVAVTISVRVFVVGPVPHVPTPSTSYTFSKALSAPCAVRASLPLANVVFDEAPSWYPMMNS